MKRKRLSRQQQNDATLAEARKRHDARVASYIKAGQREFAFMQKSAESSKAPSEPSQTVKPPINLTGDKTMANLQQIHAEIATQYSQIALQLRELNIRERDLASALGVVVQQLQMAAKEKQDEADAAKEPIKDPAPIADTAQ